MKSLYHIHWHGSHAAQHLVRGETHEAAAYLMQILWALHHVAIDAGSWNTASQMLPRCHPMDRVAFGGNAQELEVIAAYQESLRRLQRGPQPQKDKGDSKGNGKGMGDKAPKGAAEPSMS